MHTVKLLTSLVENHQVLVYALIFIGLVFEGEFILITTGILAHLGALSFPFALVFILIGGVCKTFLGYEIGRFINKKWGETKALKYLEKRVFTVMPNFNKKPFWSIFISKFIMGVNHMVIIFSGYIKIDYRKYIKAEFISTIIWAPLLLSLGYFFGYMALNVSKEIWRFSLIVLLLILGFIVLDKFVGWLYVIFEAFHTNGNGNGNIKENGDEN